MKLVCYHKEWDWIAVHEGAYAIEVEEGYFHFWPHRLTVYGTEYWLTDEDFRKDWIVIGIFDKKDEE